MLRVTARQRPLCNALNHNGYFNLIHNLLTYNGINNCVTQRRLTDVACFGVNILNYIHGYTVTTTGIIFVVDFLPNL